MSNEYKEWYRERIAEEKELVAKYPFLHVRDINGCIDTKVDFPMIGLEIPNGWYNLFYQMCDDIKDLVLKDFYFLQVKEKYNLMRCYSINSTLEVDAIIAKYERMAPYVCTICGKPANFETSSYAASFCTDCWKDHARHEKTSQIEPKTSFVVYYFNKGVSSREKTISFEDEWNRYLDRIS